MVGQIGDDLGEKMRHLDLDTTIPNQARTER